jgi:NAD(P)-dependent dehydrogenase (short-subunit alcohol dehydrogenase family)
MSTSHHNNELAGQVALIVGGSSGIGLATAKLLSERGCKVAIFAHQGVDAAIADSQPQGHAWLGIQGDASSSEAINKAILQTIQHFGGIHITVHTAAIHPYGNATDTSEDVWDRVMAINLKSVFLLAHHVLPHFQAQGHGVIANTASIQGTACQRDVCAYSTSKAAILGFTRSLSVDYAAQGIRAVSISPGAIRTPMLDLSVEKFGGHRPKEEVFADWGKGVPMGRIGEAKEVAEVIAFAVSPRASYCAGTEFVVDGATSKKLCI